MLSNETILYCSTLHVYGIKDTYTMKIYKSITICFYLKRDCVIGHAVDFEHCI